MIFVKKTKPPPIAECLRETIRAVLNDGDFTRKRAEVVAEVARVAARVLQASAAVDIDDNVPLDDNVGDGDIVVNDILAETRQKLPAEIRWAHDVMVAQEGALPVVSPKLPPDK